MTNRIETMVKAASRPGGQGPKGCVDLARPLRCAVGQSPLWGFSLPCASRNGPNPRQRGQRDFFNGLLGVVIFLAAGWSCRAETFLLPTANRALFEKGGEERFFVGTVGKPWTTGTFGCVRSDGMQMHEGLDIRCVQRDKRGEPTDPVMATADGTVAYINARPSLSNYGNYIVLRHRIDGVEIYSLYAHLHEVQPGLKAARAGQTRETIRCRGPAAKPPPGHTNGS